MDMLLLLFGDLEVGYSYTRHRENRRTKSTPDSETSAPPNAITGKVMTALTGKEEILHPTRTVFVPPTACDSRGKL